MNRFQVRIRSGLIVGNLVQSRQFSQQRTALPAPTSDEPLGDFAIGLKFGNGCVSDVHADGRGRQVLGLLARHFGHEDGLTDERFEFARCHHLNLALVCFDVVDQMFVDGRAISA